MDDPRTIDNDGVALFWRQDKLQASSFTARFLPNARSEVLEMRLQARDTGKELVVFLCHLASGSNPSHEDGRMGDVGETESLTTWLHERRAAAASDGSATVSRTHVDLNGLGRRKGRSSKLTLGLD